MGAAAGDAGASEPCAEGATAAGMSCSYWVGRTATHDAGVVSNWDGRRRGCAISSDRNASTAHSCSRNTATLTMPAAHTWSTSAVSGSGGACTALVSGSKGSAAAAAFGLAGGGR